MKDDKIYYFGTSLSEHGHYTWIIENGRMKSAGLLPKDAPFSPENLTENLQKGQSAKYIVNSPLGEFSVWAICGSPIDRRGGTKSVFWIRGVYENVSEIIMQNELCKQIIGKIK